MKILSLFNGISCGREAAKRAGIKVDRYVSCEIEESANQIAQKNWPNDEYLGDVKTIDFRQYGDFDLIIGGSPCQGFSRQGKCLNFEDPRSALFFEYVRVLKEIRETNPNVLFLLENVCMKKEWEKVISSYLEVEPIEINSKLVSAQNRPRMYWTNIPGVAQPKDKGIKLKSILEEVDTTHFIAHEGLLFDPTLSENSINLVYKAGDEVRVKQAVSKGYIVAEDGDGVNLSFPTSKSRRGRVIKQKSSTIDCVCNLSVYTNGVIRRFTTTELEKLQTLPIGYTEGIDNKARIKAIGNGWTVDVIAHILSYIK